MNARAALEAITKYTATKDDVYNGRLRIAEAEPILASIAADFEAAMTNTVVALDVT